jgi:hypothetical protein
MRSSVLRALGATVPDTLQLAEDAVVWGLPLVLTGRYLEFAASRHFPFNEFHVNPHLATPSLNVVGPNIDTLYGLAWLDLAAEPQVIEVPDTGDRYYSIQLMDAYQTTFAYIGRRTTGTKAGAYAICRPGWVGTLPAGVTAIRSNTNVALAIVRTLVEGEDDLRAAQAIQRQYSLGPLRVYPNGRKSATVQENALGLLPAIDVSHSGAAFFDELCTLLAAYPPTPADATVLARFASLGIGPGRSPSRDPALAPSLAAAVPLGLERIRLTKFSVSEVAHGWWVNSKVVGFAFEDPLLRASVNFLGPGWHLAQEALYFSTTSGADGKPLTGTKRYKLTFPKGQLPPVDAFWSLTMYGHLYSLVENSIHRYVINSFTKGLITNPDGSLDILIQHSLPSQGTANWLPSPEGPFMLFIRTYQPRPPLLNGSYELPVAQPV